jgi:cardiolipin synthase A/B
MNVECYKGPITFFGDEHLNISLISIILGMITLVNFIFVIITIFIERKKPVTALVWILILAFMPVIGFFLYLVLGRSLRLNKKRIFRLKKEYDLLYKSWLIEQKLLLDNRRIPFMDKNMEKYQDMIEMNLNISRSIYTQDNDVTVFIDAKDKYEALIKDIENATDTIHLLYFIINNDHIGKRIVDLLAQKAAQGVKVRLLYDHVGSFWTPFSTFRKLIRAGGMVSRFFPLRFGTYLRINFRNHRKIVVIDGKIGYTGGINIGDEYMGFHKRQKPWRDTHIRITGTAVYFLQERFLMDWYYASREEGMNEDSVLEKLFPPVEMPGRIGMQVVSDGPDSSDEQIKWGYIKMINSAKEKLYIQSPYFVPDDSFLQALQMAATSGVDVRVMLPAIPDKLFVYRVTTSFIKDLMDYGVKVYLYTGFLHAKMLVMDGKVTSIGTTNIDIRSFVLDFEINTFIYDTGLSRQCAEIFEADMKHCREVTREWYEARSRWIKLQEILCRLFSPLL